MRKKKWVFLLLVVTAIYLLSTKIILAQSEPVLIKATVKISICGNNIVEGGEDCDNSELNGKSCSSLGLGVGILGCDISCSFNKSGCKASAVVSASTENTTSSTTATVVNQETTEPVPEVKEEQPAEEKFIETSTLPGGSKLVEAAQSGDAVLVAIVQRVQHYDPNGDRRIQNEELKEVLDQWVRDWQTGAHSECDINGDEDCDLRDFSIMMYYVEQ